MAAKKTVDKFKKKKWFRLVAPESFDNEEIGYTLGEKPANILNRTINISLDNISGNRRMRYLSFIFKVKNIDKDNAVTVLEGHKADNSFINRLARRRKSKIDLVADVSMKDGKKARFSVAGLFDAKEEREKEKIIRKAIFEEIREEASKMTFDSFLKYMLLENGLEASAKKCAKSTSLRRIELLKSRIMAG